MISELLNGTNVRAEAMGGCLNDRLENGSRAEGRARARLKEEGGKKDGDTARSGRVVQLEDPRRHDRMREFNFLGLSIISSARAPSSLSFPLPSSCPSLSLSLSLSFSLYIYLYIYIYIYLSFTSLTASSLGARPALHRFVVLANGPPFFQPVPATYLIQPHHPRKSSPMPLRALMKPSEPGRAGR